MRPAAAGLIGSRLGAERGGPVTERRRGERVALGRRSGFVSRGAQAARATDLGARDYGSS